MPYKSIVRKRANQRKYWHSNEHIRHAQHVSRQLRVWQEKYSLSDTRILEMLDTQKDLCAACGLPFSNGFGSYAEGTLSLVPTIDHDRGCCPGETSCGRCVRGIVHHRCNRIFGIAKDDPLILRRCADYLDKRR